MTKKKFTVEVTQTIEVILDDEHLNEGFNKVFSEFMWDVVDDLEDHATHLAQLKAIGMIGFDNFAEGYGDLSKIGCSVGQYRCEESIINVEDIN